MGLLGGYENPYENITAGSVDDALSSARTVYGNVARDGVFGKNGATTIANTAMRASLVKARQRAQGVRRSLGRRLGPRSGAAAGAALRASQGLIAGESFNTRANLMAQNAQSKLQGAAGQTDLAKFMYEALQNEESKSGGLLDTLGPLASLAAGIPGADKFLDRGLSAIFGDGNLGDTLFGAAEETDSRGRKYL